MKKTDVEDYLDAGIYGAKEIKPDERRQFLGTLRERIVVALTDKQVKKKGTYKEVEELMMKNPQADLLLNGDIDFGYFSDYIQLAEKYGNPYRFISNQESETDIGLILAYPHAIDREEIYVKDEPEGEKELQTETSPNKIRSFFKKLFK